MSVRAAVPPAGESLEVALRHRRDDAIAKATALLTDTASGSDAELRIVNLLHAASTFHGYAELVHAVALESVPA